MVNKVFIRTDSQCYKRILENTKSLCNELNNYALPIFEEFLIPLSLDNIYKYCISGGKELMIQELSKQDKRSIDLKKLWAVRTLEKYPMFPQYTLADTQRQYLSYIKIGTFNDFGRVPDGKGSFSYECFQKMGVVPNLDNISDASKIYLKEQYIEQYNKLKNICSNLNIYFNFSKEELEKIFPVCFQVTDEGIVLNQQIIDNDFFKRVKQNER